MIRRYSAQFLTDSAIIQRTTVTINAAGDSVTTWSNIETVDCRLLPYQIKEASGDIAKREAVTTRYWLIMAVTTTVRAGDRFQISGLRYELTELRSVVTDRAFIDALVVRISE